MFQTSDILKKRVYALTLDFFIVIVSNYFIVASFTNFLKTVFFHFPFRTQLFLIHKLGMMSSISLVALNFAYFSLFYFVTNGRTMGKSLFGLKVVTNDNSEMSLKQSMIRAFSYFTCAFFGSFLFALSFIRKDDKSLADVLSGTNVTYDLKDQEAVADIGTEFQLSLITAEDITEHNDHNKAA